MNRFSIFMGSVVMAALLLGCNPGFQPRNSLQEIRVLALEASPLEVGFAESVTVTPKVFVPEARSVASFRWHYCPINAGAVAGYQCVDAGCDVDIESSTFDGAINLTPSDSLFACIAKLVEANEGSQAGSDSGVDPDTIASIPTVLFYELTDDEGRLFRAVKSIVLWKEKPESINRAPVISDVTVDGTSVIDGASAEAVREVEIDVGVTIDPESMDTYLDSREEEAQEEALISFYATAGSFDADRKDGLDVTSTLSFSAGENVEPVWEPPLALGEDVSSLSIFVVVRDGRGGQTAAGPFTVELTSAP